MFPNRKPGCIAIALWLLCGSFAILEVRQARAQTVPTGAMRLDDLPRPELAEVTAALERDQLLYLDTTLNTRAMGMQPALMRNGRLWMQRDALESMGVQLAQAGDWIDLEAISGTQMLFDATHQSLVIDMPFSMLRWPNTELTTSHYASPTATAAAGMLFNYDLYGYATGQSRALNAATEARLFKANSVLSNTMLTRITDNSSPYVRGADRGTQIGNMRLDTTFSHSWQEQMLTLRIGDTTTGALPWTRATRIGGVQIARNFGLQPYRTRMPIPAMMGTSAVPSDIELFINGVRQYQGEVPAGPFQLTSPTGLTGAGNAQVVLTDLLGRRTTLQYDFYGSSQLLAKGLSDWSAEFGWVRRKYGLSSFSYASDPAASGTWSYGLTDSLTLQGHTEVSAHLLNAGGGAVWLLGKQLGVASIGLAASQHDSRTGALAQLGYDWSNERYYASLQATRQSNAFRDTASLYDEQRQKASGRAVLGYSHPTIGNLNVGYMHLQNFAQDRQRYVTMGWNRPLGQTGQAYFSINHNLDDNRRSSVQFSVTWYLDSKVNLGSTVTHQNHQTSVVGYANQRTPPEGGWGWSAQAQSGSNGGGQARVDYLGRAFEANATVGRYGDSTSSALGASGSLIWMGNHAFASRRVDDGFAVVSTNGVPHVPVLRENVNIGETNERGVLLVSNLGAYRANRISIDSLQLPAQMRVPVTQQTVAPTDRAGVLVDFPIMRIRSATIILQDAKGNALPLGSLATLRPTADANVDGAPGQTQSSVVGYDGAAYFENLGSTNNQVRVYLPDGSGCHASVTWPQNIDNEIPMIGPVPCHTR